MSPHLTSPSRARAYRPRGFGLIEMVITLIILSILAAIAVPKFISTSREARVDAINTLATTLMSTAANVHAMCKLDSTCSYDIAYQHITIGGRGAWVNYGWLEAARGQSDELPTWVTYTGFTLVDPLGGGQIDFTLDGAPNPSQCKVHYNDALNQGPTSLPTVTASVGGC